MARTLSPTLEAQQKWGLISWPYVKARIVKKWGDVIRYDFESLYSGEEDDYLHTAAMPDDGSLIRLRVANPLTTKNLYYQRVTNPTPESDFSAWTDLEIPNVVAVASCAYGANVSQFYINASQQMYHRESSTNGATWGDWQLIQTGLSYGVCSFDAACKNNGDLCLLWAAEPARYEHNLEFKPYFEPFYGAKWLAQTFDGYAQHTFTMIALYLRRVGNPGTLTVSLRAVDVSHRPTGPDLTSGSIDGNSITTDPSGARYEIELTPYLYPSALELAIVVRVPGGSDTNRLEWQFNPNNPYPLGQAGWSDNAGSTWTMNPNSDAIFEEWGLSLDGSKPMSIYRKRRLTDVWETPATRPGGLENITGISLYYDQDWHIVATYGKDDSTKAVVSCVLGDGHSYPADIWSSWQSLIERSATEPYNYHAPCVRRTDTTRLYFIESFTQEETQRFIWYSHSPPSATFELNAWLEPVPMNITTEYGVVFCQQGSYAWLTNANRVFRALATEDALVLTARLLEVDSRDYPDIFKGSLKVVIDNTGGWYNDFNRLGQQLEVGIGYRTSAGYESSLVPFRWITKFKLKAPPWYPLRMIYPVGIIGTLEIETEDAWTFLYRYRTRRHLEWAAGEKSIKELLQFFIARCGLDFDVISQSDAVQNFKPKFDVRVGTSYRTAIKNLLKMVPDQLVFRDAKVLLRNPTTEEAVDWTYNTIFGTDLLVFRGSYGATAWDPNRAEVWGDTFMKMDANWPQVGMVRDRLSRVTTPTYPDTTRAGERADAELRRAEILTGGESGMNAPVNCGLEPWDVLQITDTNAGVSAIRRRVLRIKAYWNARHWSYQQIIKLGAD